MDTFTACCETCEMNWTEEEQEEQTGKADPPDHCIYCGSSDVLVEESS